ncbi:MAG: integration host factor subunit alpha [Arenicellales bacterium]
MSSTITKADLANTLFDELGLNKREAKEFVELFFEKIREALEGGESVNLSGFGGFTIREKNSRPGRNPKTGETVPVSARRVVTFRASQRVKEDVGANTQMIASVVDAPEART